MSRGPKGVRRLVGGKRDNWEAGIAHVSDQLQRHDDGTSRIPLSERLKHLTWAWFTLTMGTAGLALVIHNNPYQFRGLDVIGSIVFILTLVYFVLLVIGITARFVMTPSALKSSLTHPTESLFVPCSLISVAAILSNAAGYGEPHAGAWLPVTLRVCFWIYLFLSTTLSVVQFSFLFSGTRLPLHSMTPAWVLPIFPAMLVGTIASSIAASQPPDQRLPILVAGVAYQGLGFIVATLIYPLFIGRLIQDGLPAPAVRPGMFIAVGPPGYTTVAIIGMTRAIPSGYGFFETHPIASEVLRIMAVWIGIWTWCLAFWFFAISTVAVLGAVVKRQLHFSMVWWAMVFPNVGFAIATGHIGVELGSAGVQWVASAMTLGIVIIWIIVMFAQVRAVLSKKILWPGKDEDSTK